MRGSGALLARRGRGVRGGLAGHRVSGGDMDRDGLDDIVIGAPALSVADQHGVYIFGGYRL